MAGRWIRLSHAAGKRDAYHQAEQVFRTMEGHVGTSRRMIPFPYTSLPGHSTRRQQPRCQMPGGAIMARMPCLTARIFRLLFENRYKQGVLFVYEPLPAAASGGLAGGATSQRLGAVK